MLVRHHRARIEAVVRALLTKESLSREELDALTGRSIDEMDRCGS
jgi:hypothetical protein